MNNEKQVIQDESEATFRDLREITVELRNAVNRMASTDSRIALADVQAIVDKLDRVLAGQM